MLLFQNFGFPVPNLNRYHSFFSIVEGVVKIENSYTAAINWTHAIIFTRWSLTPNPRSNGNESLPLKGSRPGINPSHGTDTIQRPNFSAFDKSVPKSITQELPLWYSADILPLSIY
jgi:hypothetical protein